MRKADKAIRFLLKHEFRLAIKMDEDRVCIEATKGGLKATVYVRDYKLPQDAFTELALMLASA